MLFFVATPTPFDNRGRLDLPRLRAHVLTLAAQGVDGFVPNGPHAEFLYLTVDERKQILETVLDAARGRPVYPCTWHPSLRKLNELSVHAVQAGASGVMLPPPLYHTLDDDAVIAHYRPLRGLGLPVIGMHEPARIPTPIRTETYARLRKDGVLAGMLDSSGDPWRLQRLCDADPGAVYCGDDRILGQAGTIRTLGGFVSLLGNLYPRFCQRIYRDGETQLADALVERVQLIHAAGGFRAVKSTLGFGFRNPIPAPTTDALFHIPPAETP